MNRRYFLKTLAVTAAVSVVPAIGVSLPGVPEPVKWTMEECVYSSELAIGAQWPNGVMYAIKIDMPDAVDREASIGYCKQAIRQWYLERHV